MSFSADWLTLRSDADRAARSSDLAADLAEMVDGRDSLRVLDLGSGTGANLAATAPFLTSEQSWVLIDADKGLLDQVTPEDGIIVERKFFDLAGDLGPLFDPAPELVTASAFFDLCGAAWIDRLCDHCAETGAMIYAVLSYDGREEWSPPHPLDADVLAAFHADQRTDKGLGTSLGPEAAAHLAEALRQRGYEVHTARSDWELTAKDDNTLITALAEGSANATRPVLGETADTWLTARRDAEAVMIGHIDVLGVPPDWTAP